MRKSAFRKTVYTHQEKYGRSFSWRHTKNPYHILVSEIMLQQTQVERVVPKYKEFIKQFPTFQALSKISLHEVLFLWQGLGYNNRAKRLKETACIVCEEYNGKLPKREEELIKLPGIGPYTAGAICVFAWNKPSVFIETNIRTVYLHAFFPHHKKVHDKEILKLIEETIDQENPRKWYTALMDYGAYLKQRGVKLNARSMHYTKQSPFKGSDREVRGAIVRELVGATQGLTLVGIHKRTGFSINKLKNQSKTLVNEGLIQMRRKKLILP